MQVKFLGHACVEVCGDKRIIVDPYLTGNPKAAAGPADIEADYILLTHGHGDHVGDTVEIANRCGAKVVCMVEVARWLEQQGVDAMGMNIGGSFDFGDGFKVKLVPAWHSSQMPDGSYGGTPVGFVFWLGGKCFYHAGDTGLFGDMRDVIALHGIDWAFLPIGDFYTMGPEDAVIAAKWLASRNYVPIHYDTFELLRQDGTAWAERVEAECPGAKAWPLAPGESLEI